MSIGRDLDLSISYMEYLIAKSLIFEYEGEEYAIDSIESDAECWGIDEIVESVDKLIERLNALKTKLKETQRE